MSFHRTPAEMAADVSYMRSPVGESASRHMLWLTPEDLTWAGPEPEPAPSKIDRTNLLAVALHDQARKEWGDWWGRICSRSRIRQREAFVDQKWTEEYTRLLQARRDAAPAEWAAHEAEMDAYDKANPMRGLTEEEAARKAQAWKRRGEICAQYNKLQRKSPADPLLETLLVELRACDALSDQLYALSNVRIPAMQQAA